MGVTDGQQQPREVAIDKDPFGFDSMCSHPSDAQDHPPANEKGKRWWWWVGVVVAILLIIGLVVLLTVLFYESQICEERVAETGAEPGPVWVCRRLAVTDPPVVAIGVAVLALVGVFYSEVSGFGITLKRSVTQAKDAANEARDQAASNATQIESFQRTIVQQVSDLRLNLSQSLSARQELNVNVIQEARPTGLRTQADPAPGPRESAVLDIIRADLPERFQTAFQLAQQHPTRPVHVAIVGPGPGSAVVNFPPFAGQILPPIVVPGADLESDRSIGAAVLSQVLAIEPYAEIQPIAVFDRGGQTTTSAQLVAGLAAALQSRPQLVLLGYGGPVADPVTNDLIGALSESTMVIAPAGNSNREAAAFPAALPQVIGISSIDADMQRSVFTNWGPNVDLAAEGVDALSLLGIDPKGEATLGQLSGTSVSAARTAGVAAMLLARSDVQPTALPELLRSTALPIAPNPAIDPDSALRSAHR